MIRLLEEIRFIIDQAAGSNDLKVEELKYLDDETNDMVIHRWNDTRIEYPLNLTVVELFEEQVRKTPDNIAVVYENKSLSYRELNEKANCLANYLIREYGIGADDIVALCLDRGEQVIVSTLGVMKAGAAYVPMIPDYPEERLAYITSDTGAKIILANKRHEEKLKKAAGGAIRIEAVDSEPFRETLDTVSAENPARRASPENLAYIIYTSGTTGVPKGVMIEHRGLTNLALHQGTVFNLSGDEWDGKIKNCVWYSTYIFDAHAWEIYTVLIYGHQLCIVTDEQRMNLEMLGEYIEKNTVKVGTIPPALLNTENILPLEILVMAGEVTGHEIMERYIEAGVKVINAYGPTESTVCATLRYYQKGDLNRDIGRPLANTTAYILDERMLPVSIGAVGELHIGGVQLARGYLNKSELTAEKFVKNPFQTKEEKAQGYNGRLYKTGDLARYLDDGNIEFLGRNDFQVKIRGFRIELGEIENAVCGYDGVKQCVVIDRERNGVKYLAAYYVGEVEADKLREYLNEKLPEYMVPGAYMQLERLPLNASGKLDRKALPEPDTYGTEDEYEAPANKREAALAKIFAEVLGMEAEKLSVTEDFFRMGGNSIMAIRLANGIQREIDWPVKVADIFAHKTVRKLLNEFGERRPGGERPKIVRRDFNRAEDQKLSYAQGRLWFIENYEGGSNAYNIPLIEKLKDDVSTENLTPALLELVKRHEILRSVIKSDAQGEEYQEVLPWHENLLQIPVGQYDGMDEAKADILKECKHIFKLDSELPIRVKLFSVGKERYLSIVVHHIAFDGWSVNIFIGELIRLYDYYQNGGEYPLKELKIQYRDYAVWQREYLRGGVLETQLEYWKRKLAGYETLNLLTDKERPARFQYEGENVFFEFDQQTGERIRAVAKEMGVSVYTVMLSAYYLLLSVYSGQKDIVVGTLNANREYEEISETVGFFVNALAMRQMVDVEGDIGELIALVANSAREAQLYQDIPFEMMISALKIQTGLDRHPLFQNMFIFQAPGEQKSDEESNALFVSSNTDHGGLEYSVAKFDLTLTVIDEGKTIRGIFNYARSLFVRETIDSYIETFTEIVGQIALSAKENMQ
jgi:amino acid adenylation domain-containing protein